MPQESSLEAALKRLLDGVASEADLQALRQGRITLATAKESIALGGDITNSLVNIGGQVIEFKEVSPEAMREALSRVYPTRLYQLPADLADFTGREEEVEKLLAVLRGGAGQAAISALGGLGGVGKTALAVHVAHKLAPDYPEAQIIVDLLGTSESPLSPVAAMENVIKAFLPEARLPENSQEMEDLYRSILYGKRAFLLLDNAADKAQVRPLLPPAPCGVMVTSRRTMVLPGLQSLNLDVLPEAQAVELLATILGERRAGPGELPDLARRCGYLPLALRVAGSFLAGHPDWTVAEYLTALADEKERLRHLKDDVDDVEATLGLSSAQLTRDMPDLAARWQMLAVFPGSFDRLAAAAVWEVEEGEARDGLSELLARSLVLFDPDKQRYRLHDLMRLVAQNTFGYGGEEPDRGAEGERLTQAALRHSAYYAGVLRAANELYLKGGEAIQAGLDLFDTEWDNIRVGQAWAAAQSERNKEATALCSSYPGAGSLLGLRLHSRQNIDWLEAARSAARSLGDREAEGRHLGNLGLAYAALGEPRRAIEYHEQTLIISREIGDRRGEGSALGNLGLAYFAIGEFRRAIDYHEQNLAIAREMGDRRGGGNALNNLGLAYAALGEPRRAIEFYEKVLIINQEMGDRLNEGNTLGNLGTVYAYLGEFRRALEYLEQALAIAREIGDRRGEGTALGNLGNVYFTLGDPRRAMEFYEQHLTIAREMGDRGGEGTALGNLGTAYAYLGEFRRAIEYHEQYLAIAREIGDRRGEGNALWNMSLALRKLGDKAQTMEYAEAALAIFEQIEDPHAPMVRQQLEEWHREG